MYRSIGVVLMNIEGVLQARQCVFDSNGAHFTKERCVCDAGPVHKAYRVWSAHNIMTFIIISFALLQSASESEVMFTNTASYVPVGLLVLLIVHFVMILQ